MRRRHSRKVSEMRWLRHLSRCGLAKTFSDDETCGDKLWGGKNDCIVMGISRESLGIYGRFHPSLSEIYAISHEPAMTIGPRAKPL
jgi:hypothetical protein